MKVLDAVFFPILMPLKIIVDAVLKLVELVVLIVTMIPELLGTALSIFNPSVIFSCSLCSSFRLSKLSCVFFA